MDTLQQFRSLSRPIQMLILNQLSFNTGFYMLLPYLAEHLSDNLGFAAWIVGLVLGLRTLSQQGLFVVGGSLADRIGYKPVIIAGCIIRTIGFGLLGFVTTLPGTIVAVVLSGFAAALFSPAVQAYLAHEAGDQRIEAFALFNMVGEIGTLVGPLIGALLLGVSFQLVCLVASALFLVITVVQFAYLPQRAGSEAASTDPVFADWQHALANRTFVRFALGMLGYFVLYNQMYLGLPFEVQRLTGSTDDVALLFVLSSLMWIGGQVPLTRFCKARLGALQAIVLGLSLMGLAFAPLLLATPWLPFTPTTASGTYASATASFAASGAPPTSFALHAINISPVIISTMLLTLGMMTAQPFAMGMIPPLSGGRRVGTYYGLYYLAAGAGATIGNTLSGLIFDTAETTGLSGLPWLFMIAIGAGSAVSIAVLARRAQLPEPEND